MTFLSDHRSDVIIPLNGNRRPSRSLTRWKHLSSELRARQRWIYVSVCFWIDTPGIPGIGRRGHWTPSVFQIPCRIVGSDIHKWA